MRLAGIQPEMLWPDSGCALSGPLRCVPLGLRRARQGGERHPALRGRSRQRSLRLGTIHRIWDFPAILGHSCRGAAQESPDGAGKSPNAGNLSSKTSQTGRHVPMRRKCRPPMAPNRRNVPRGREIVAAPHCPLGQPSQNRRNVPRRTNEFYGPPDRVAEKTSMSLCPPPAS